jgi:hypothetical protein
MDDYETAFRRAKKAWEQLDNLWQRRQQASAEARAALLELNAAIGELVKVEADRSPQDEAARR